MVIRATLRLALAGVLFGLLAALAVARSLASLLFGIASADPLTFAATAAVLAAVALVAGSLPARRAARIAPVSALRAN